MEDLKLKNSTFTFTPTSSVVPIFELKENGDILVKGNLIENDKKVVDAMREFLNLENLFCECENNSDIYSETKTYHTSCNKEVKTIRVK
jgi:hypothetical protein|tara:strand:+ start:1504 stop:1770 length:267 start_codon:yes stop_codon:yes gene_type:complete